MPAHHKNKPHISPHTLSNGPHKSFALILDFYAGYKTEQPRPQPLSLRSQQKSLKRKKVQITATYLVLFFLLFSSSFFLQTLFWPARSLLFSFWCLHLFCLLGHVGQIPNHCLLLEVSESRVTTNSNTQHRQFHGFNWVQALAVYYATQRYVGHADCRATKSLTTEFGLLVNCRRQMLMCPYWRTLISSWPLRALRVAELADEANQMHLTNIYIDFPNTFSFCELVCKIKPI